MNMHKEEAEMESGSLSPALTCPERLGLGSDQTLTGGHKEAVEDHLLELGGLQTILQDPLA